MPIATASRKLAIAASVAALSTTLAACGSSSSDNKPGYCQDKKDLQTTVTGLAKINPINDGVDAVKAQLTQVKTDADALVASAKADFPAETSAITTSVDALTSSVSGLSSNPSAAALVTVASSIKSFATAVDTFGKATASKC